MVNKLLIQFISSDVMLVDLEIRILGPPKLQPSNPELRSFEIRIPKFHRTTLILITEYKDRSTAHRTRS